MMETSFQKDIKESFKATIPNFKKFKKELEAILLAESVII